MTDMSKNNRAEAPLSCAPNARGFRPLDHVRVLGVGLGLVWHVGHEWVHVRLTRPEVGDPEVGRFQKSQLVRIGSFI